MTEEKDGIAYIKDFCKLASDVCTESLVESIDKAANSLSPLSELKIIKVEEPNRYRYLVESIKECAETMDSEAGFKQCLTWALENSYPPLMGNISAFEKGVVLEGYNRFKETIKKVYKEDLADRMRV